MSSDRRHHPPSFPSAIEPASVQRRIPERTPEIQEPDLEKYKKHLAKAIAIDDRVLNEKRGRLVEIREAGPVAPEKQQETKALVRELERDVELIQKRVREQTRLNINVHASNEMNNGWHEEEQIKRGQRALVDQMLQGKKIPEQIKQKYGNHILTLFLAAYLNEDVMSEYSPEEKAKFRHGIDRMVAKASTENRNGNKLIGAHLHRAITRGYIALPPPPKKGVIVAPAPFLAGVDSHLTQTWDLVVKEINKQKQEPEKPVDPKLTSVFQRAKPLERPRKEYTQAKAFLEQVRKGDQVVVNLIQLGRVMTCEFTVEEITPRERDVVLSSKEAKLSSPQNATVGPYNIVISTTGLPRVAVIAATGASAEQLAHGASSATATLFKILD